MIAAALLTAAVETVFLALCGYRQRVFLLLAVLANLCTNLTLNLLAALLSATPLAGWLWLLVYPLEAAVVTAEYLLYRGFSGPSRKLLCCTVAANALSYGVGLLLFGHV